MKVKIMSGVSGSGKSTYIATHFPNAVVCSADHYFIKEGKYEFNRSALSSAHGDCLVKYVECLTSQRELVVVDNTNTSIAEIAPYAALALAYGYDLEIVMLSCDPEVAHERNQHNVPKKTVKGQYERLERLPKYLPPWWPLTKVEQ